ncbi:MAG TPA: glycosyltransferase family 39 protein, partial [Candidatus Methylomirabilis sp.]|nr:glycosyltransferase family 39 protein [Candidatus Methylomirabilis sp.]
MIGEVAAPDGAEDHPLAPSRSYAIAAAGAVVLLAIAVRLLFFNAADFAGDELHYAAYADRISARGVSEFRRLAEEYASDPERWIYPPPIRVLYMAAGAAACRIAGSPCTDRAIAAVSLASGIAMVVLALAMAWRMFSARVGILAGLLVALSPLGLQLSRRALQDEFFALPILLAVWAFWERSRSTRRGWDVLLGTALVAALLTKESAFIFPLYFYGALLFPSWLTSREFPFNRSTLAAILASLATAGLIFLALVPDVWLLLRVHNAWLSATETGEYVPYSQGRWFRYLVDFALISPAVTVLGVGYYFSAAREKIDGYLGRFALLLFLAFSLLPLKNLRYVSFLDPPLRILAVLALVSMFRHPAAVRYARLGVAATVAVLAIYDLSL